METPTPTNDDQQSPPPSSPLFSSPPTDTPTPPLPPLVVTANPTPDAFPVRAVLERGAPSPPPLPQPPSSQPPSSQPPSSQPPVTQPSPSNPVAGEPPSQPPPPLPTSVAGEPPTTFLGGGGGRRPITRSIAPPDETPDAPIVFYFHEEYYCTKKMTCNLHVVVFPWSAFGHMIPFHQLSVALAKSGVRVSYISTPRNIQRLPQIPLSLSELVKYEKLQMPRVKELPEEAEATIDVTSDTIQYLKVAHDLLEEPFAQTVAKLSPDWIVTDYASSWVVNVSKDHSIPLMYFSVFSATTLAYAKHKGKLFGEGKSSVSLQPYETPALRDGLYNRDASGKTDAERMVTVVQGCTAVAIRSCDEFEGENIELFKRLMKKHVVLTGVLPPLKQETENQNENWSEALKWLDQQDSKSVVFVGFGTECKLTKEQVHEIAHGLELSGLPYLWSLRRPLWVNKDDVEALPEGFIGSSKIGRVCFGWAPQQRIVAHPAIGGCLFHSGWGSIIESLEYGHRLVVLPFVADQGLNARMLVYKGLAIEVERRPEDGWFSRDDVAMALRRAMVEEEGDKMWARAKDVARVFGDGKLQHECYIGGLVEYMKNAST